MRRHDLQHCTLYSTCAVQSGTHRARVPSLVPQAYTVFFLMLYRTRFVLRMLAESGLLQHMARCIGTPNVGLLLYTCTYCFSRCSCNCLLVDLPVD